MAAKKTAKQRAAKARAAKATTGKVPDSKGKSAKTPDTKAKAPPAKKVETVYDFSLEKLGGGALDLKQFEGKPLVIVNTASKCGFTPQYAGLEDIWRNHKAEGLVVIGVPSNDFGGQEPGNAAEIGAFCEKNYGVDFIMADKVAVKGSKAHPLFKFLAKEGGVLAAPKWNFYKYLVGRDGHVKTWFSSITKPDSSRFKSAVKSIISK